jgi:alpha-L-fucosidase 2
MKSFLVFICLVISFVCAAQNKTGLKLWYNHQSGKTWENALPIGNGRLGAMIYGNVDTEIIQLNEHTLWSGSPNRNDNPLAFDSLARIRQLIFNGKQKEAEQLANKVIVSKKSHGQMFEPAGELQLRFEGHDNYSSYYRELDIEKAIAKTTYKVGDVSYTREVLASFPDRVIVMHLTASKPNSISFTAFYTTVLPMTEIKAVAGKQLTISGTTVDHEGVKGMLRYKGITELKTDGGTSSANDTSISIKNATAVTIYISIATSFNSYNDVSGNENERAASYLNKAVTKSFQQIKPSHIAA